ncbi:hypothetical protein SAMN05216570_1397 [Dyella sp. OK004]|nr:hypothetical protein SAMN05216570_1397 [Dyella sp. OK004]
MGGTCTGGILRASLRAIQTIGRVMGGGVRHVAASVPFVLGVTEFANVKPYVWCGELQGRMGDSSVAGYVADGECL